MRRTCSVCWNELSHKTWVTLPTNKEVNIFAQQISEISSDEWFCHLGFMEPTDIGLSALTLLWARKESFAQFRDNAECDLMWWNRRADAKEMSRVQKKKALCKICGISGHNHSGKSNLRHIWNDIIDRQRETVDSHFQEDQRIMRAAAAFLSQSKTSHWPHVIIVTSFFESAELAMLVEQLNWK